MENKKIDVKKTIIKLVSSIIVIAIFVVLLLALFKALGIDSLNEEKIQTEISKLGVWAPLAFIFLSFLQVTFIPIPGAVTIIAGNYLFGTWLSFLYSYIGMFLGALLAFFLGRKIGRPFVNWIVGDKETVDYYLKKLKGKETIILFFMFLLPMFPDDILCSIAGIMPITYSVFIFMQLITRFTSIGGTLLFMSGEIIPYHGWGLVLIVFLNILAIIAFILAMKNSEKINDYLISFVDKHFKKKRKDL